MLKNKKTTETTASRKPLFHPKGLYNKNAQQNPKTSKTLKEPGFPAGFFFKTQAIFFLKRLSDNTKKNKAVRSIVEHSGTAALLVNVECHITNGLPAHISEDLQYRYQAAGLAQPAYAY